jgi:hypothetical protein
VCYVGQSDVRIPFPPGISEVTDDNGKVLQRGKDWDWLDGSFRANRAATGASGCPTVSP